MPDIIGRSKEEALKEKLAAIANSSSRFSPELSQAIQDLLAAISYSDNTLIDASINGLFEALRNVAKDLIEKEVAASEAAKNGLREAWRDFVDGTVCENLDDASKVIESFVDERLEKMMQLRDNIVRVLEKHEYLVENAFRLEEGMRDWQKMKEDILGNWPLTSKALLPANRQMIAEARAAIARGETGLRREDLIWGNSTSKEKHPK
jgi:hypothetical protein